MDRESIIKFVNAYFDETIKPELYNFIKIKNISPAYDKEWVKNGEAKKAANLLKEWAEKQFSPLESDFVHLHQFEEGGYTPLLRIQIPANKGDPRNILLYGHMDKQPGLDEKEWKIGHPFDPIEVNGQLYGRGSTDDGYSLFAAVSAIKAIREFKDYNLSHPGITILIEGAEESNTSHLSYWINVLRSAKVLPDPDLVFALDSGCATYDRLWLTSSLRGNVSLNLKIQVSDKDENKSQIYSGYSGGVIPDPFIILHKVLNRIQDPKTGELTVKEAFTTLPEGRKFEISKTANYIGKIEDYKKNELPLYEETETLSQNLEQLIINSTWKPTVTVTGVNTRSTPSISDAGNASVRELEVKLSIRYPPKFDNTIHAKEATQAIKNALRTKNEIDDFNAKIIVDGEDGDDGYNGKEYDIRLTNIISIASLKFFNKDFAYVGEGGSVPFCNMFKNLYPKADFIPLGVAGPNSNIHGPDESLNLDFCKRLIMCLTYIISEY
jgi:acetylornithine deacetylase/succinyl-diaminopimelate desuccinylase-like protein